MMLKSKPNYVTKTKTDEKTKVKQMEYISYNKLWRNEFINSVSKDRVQDINLNQVKIKVNDTYKTDEKYQ